MIKLAITVCVILLSVHSFAGPNVIGNGGNGIFINDELMLLDLVEASAYEKPFFKQESAEQYQIRVKNALSSTFDSEVIDLVSRKITELSFLDLIYTESLLKTFEALRWNLVDYKLSAMPVESPVQAEQVQIAIRTGDNLLIDKNYWKKLSSAHKAALIFHEANFVLIEPVAGGSNNEFQKSAFQSRLLTGYIFSENIKKEFFGTFSQRLHPLFPSRLMTVENERIYAIYATTTFFGPVQQKTITVNPYLEIFYDSSSTTVSILNLDYADLASEVCHKGEFPNFIQLNTHILNLQLEKGDNNTQNYISFSEAGDTDFGLLVLQAETCDQQMQTFSEKLKKHISLVLF